MGIPDFANEPLAKPAPSPSQVEDLVTVIPSPSTAFEHRRDGKFGLAMLVLTVIMIVISFLSRASMAPIFEGEFARNMKVQMAKNPQITAEMVDKMSHSAGTYAWIAAVFTPLLLIVIGLALWLSGKLVGSRQTATQGIAVATFAFVPRVIGAIFGWAQTLFMSPDTLNGMMRISASPARFLDPDVASPITIALLGRFDIFVIWSTILLAIGLSVTGQVTRKQGAVGAFVVWLLATAFAMAGAMRNMA